LVKKNLRVFRQAAAIALAGLSPIGCVSAGAFVAYRVVKRLPSRLAACASVLLPLPALAEDEAGERPPISAVLFGSLEAGPAKTFAAAGMKRAFGTAGLDASGFRALLNIGMSREQANRSPPHGTAYKAEAQTLIGYEWRIGDVFVSLYAGFDYESEQRPCSCGVVTTSRYGQRIQADLWATPMPDMMLQASAYASTLDRRLWGKLAPGWVLPQGFQPQLLYLGPEIEAYRERSYSKFRLGLHLSGLRVLNLNWRLSAGWQRTSDRPSEAYATLGAYWRR